MITSAVIAGIAALGALLTGVGTVGGVIASNIIESKKNEAQIDEQNRHNVEIEKAVGRGLDDIINDGNITESEIKKLLSVLGGLGFEMFDK